MVKNPPVNAGDIRDVHLILKSGKSLAEGNDNHGKSHGQRSLADYRPWGHKELDTTEAK